MHQLSPRQLADWLADPQRPGPLLLDIREGWEVNLCRLDGSRHLPMQAVPARMDSLPKDEAIVVYCHHGVRSMRVAAYLDHHGFRSVYNLQGGIAAWADEVDREMARY
jgi:rhodanese-related sulfurtransferase